MIRSIAALIFVFSLSLSAYPFSWNGETVKALIDQVGRIDAPIEPKNKEVEGTEGVIKRTINPGGHNLATRRGVLYAVEKAKGDIALEQSLFTAFGEDPDVMSGEYGFFVQKILKGNWLNEVQTMLDANGAEKVAGSIAALKNRGRHKVVGEDNRSRFYDPITGYNSSNFIHSMLVSPEDHTSPLVHHPRYSQASSLERIKEFAVAQLIDAMTHLLNARKAEDEKKAIVPALSLDLDVSKAITRYYKNDNLKDYVGENLYKRKYWYEWGIRDLGSLFHMIQDSAVACTEKANALVPNCLPGDGHGIIENNKVVSLSDGAWYARADSQHGPLDDLYVPRNLADIPSLIQREGLEDSLYGTFDPAIAMGEILIDTAQAINAIYAEHAPHYPEVFAPMRGTKKYIALRVLNRLGIEGYSPAQEDSISTDWVRVIAPDIESAAVRIATEHVFSRYAEKLSPLPPVPQAETGERSAIHSH